MYYNSSPVTIGLNEERLHRRIALVAFHAHFARLEVQPQRTEIAARGQVGDAKAVQENENLLVRGPCWWFQHASTHPKNPKILIIYDIVNFRSSSQYPINKGGTFGQEVWKHQSAWQWLLKKCGKVWAWWSSHLWGWLLMNNLNKLSQWCGRPRGPIIDHPNCTISWHKASKIGGLLLGRPHLSSIHRHT